MYNEYYKSWIPDVNVEKLKQNGFYKNILKDISDEDITYAWDSQVYTLGVQTYNKTGYLEYCSCEGCLVHSQYNYNLLTLATVLKLFLIQRGGDGSLSLTGQITFAEAAVLKTGMSKDWDGGYNSSQYGSPYYNLSTLTKELMVIVNKNVTRTRFSNIKSNQMSIQCKRPTGTIFESDTLRVSQTDQKISFNLWLSPNSMLTSEYLSIKYTVQNNPYLDFNAQSLLIFGSNTISIEPNQEDNLEARVKISEESGNLLEAKEDGLYSSGGIVDFPITIEQGGTGKTNKTDALLALLPDITGQNGKVLGVVNGIIAWVDKGGEAKNIVFGNGLEESEPDPETQIVTVSTKVNPSEFRYNDNGVIELSDQVTNSLAKADSSVQTVNNTPPDADGNVNVAGSLPVITLISDFVGEISVLKDWLLAQPDQRSTLYIKTQKLPNIQIIVTATGFTQTWETLANYIKTQVRALYDGCPNFTCIYNTDGELELSTNDILNPIQMYIPIVPDNESLNVQMKLVPPGAVIVSQPYATIDQVNTIVNNAVIPLQQDIKLLNLDMFFADYYIGISINYLLSGKWDGNADFAYNTILDALLDTNTLKFTLANSTDQFPCPLTITKQQFIDFIDLDTFMEYVSDEITSVYGLGEFRLSYNDNQGFMATNLNSKVGVLVCEQDNNNLAVIMKLTNLTGAKDRIYTEFSENSLQQQIIDNKLIIDDVFINKIKNGENVTIDVDPATNTATFSATGGSGGANKVTVSVNGANPVAYNVDGTGNIAINVPLTTSLTSNLLFITNATGINAGKTSLQADVSNQLTINSTSKQLALSTAVAASLAKADSALQDITTTNLLKGPRTNNILALSAPIASDTQLGFAQADGSTITAYNGTFSAKGGGSSVDFNNTVINELSATILPTQYSAFPGCSVTLQKINPYYQNQQLYINRLLSDKSTNYSGGLYGVYTNFSGYFFETLISKSIPNTQPLIDACGATADIFVQFAGGISRVSFVPSKLATLLDIAQTIETSIKNNLTYKVATFTCKVNNENNVLELSSNDLLNPILFYNGTSSNLQIAMGLSQGAGGQLFSAGFSNLLFTIQMPTHDSKFSSIVKPFVENGNTTQFIIQITESGTALPSLSGYAVCSFTAQGTGKKTINQNNSYDLINVGILNNCKPNSANPNYYGEYSPLSLADGTFTPNTLIVTEVIYKNISSNYRYIYITASYAYAAYSSGSIRITFSLEDGMTNPIGSIVIIGNNKQFTFENYAIKITGTFKTNPRRDYNKNNYDLLLEAQDIVQKPFITSGLPAVTIPNVPATYITEIPMAKTTILQPSTNILAVGVSLVFLLQYKNYTQSFSSQMLLFNSGNSAWQDSSISFLLNSDQTLNGQILTSEKLFTLPVINPNRYCIINLSVEIINNITNITFETLIQPTSLYSPTVNGGSELGQSDLSQGLDAMIIPDKSCPITGNSAIISNITYVNGIKTQIIVIPKGNIYKAKISGTAYTNNSFQFDLPDNPNPVLIGLMNVNNKNERYIVEFFVDPLNYTIPKGFNGDIIIDLTDAEEDLIFRKCMVTVSAENARIFIEDHFSIMFYD